MHINQGFMKWYTETFSEKVGQDLTAKYLYSDLGPIFSVAFCVCVCVCVCVLKKLRNIYNCSKQWLEFLICVAIIG